MPYDCVQYEMDNFCFPLNIDVWVAHCEVCGFEGPEHSVTDHMVDEHNEGIAVCSECGQSCANVIELQKHFQM